jgi:hypothetical protein
MIELHPGVSVVDYQSGDVGSKVLEDFFDVNVCGGWLVFGLEKRACGGVADVDTNWAFFF